MAVAQSWGQAGERTPQDTNKPLIVFFWFTWAAPADMKTAAPWPPAESVVLVLQKGRNLSWLTQDLHCLALKLQTTCFNLTWQCPDPAELPTCWKEGRRSSYVPLQTAMRCIKNDLILSSGLMDALDDPWYLCAITLGKQLFEYSKSWMHKMRLKYAQAWQSFSIYIISFIFQKNWR